MSDFLLKIGVNIRCRQAGGICSVKHFGDVDHTCMCVSKLSNNGASVQWFNDVLLFALFVTAVSK